MGSAKVKIYFAFIPGLEWGVELLVIVSAFAIWWFDNWSGPVDKVVNLWLDFFDLVA
jgi:hypothetical protein